MKFLAKENASVDARGGLIKSWSYSSLKVFQSCPYRAYLRYGIKAAGLPQTEERERANERGSDLHEVIEDYVQGVTPQLAATIKHRREEVERLRIAHEENPLAILVEDEWAFDHTWKPVDWRSPEAWCRMKLDVAEFESPTSMVAHDWKSGKKFGNEGYHKRQLELYCIGALVKYPDLEFVKGLDQYIDQASNNTLAHTMSREQLAAPLRRWTENAIAMTSATTFRPKPNGHNCKFCEYNQPDSITKCEYGVQS